MLYNLHFFSSECRLFHNATLFGFCITHILNTWGAKIWKKKSVAKRLITSWSSVFLEKLTGSQPVKKFCTFYGMAPSHFLKIQLKIILPSMPLSLPSGIFQSGFPTTPYAPLSSPIRATCPIHLNLLYMITQITFGEEYRSVSSSLCSFLQSCYLIPLRPKYSPQHPVLRHPQPMFLPQGKRPGFTPIQNKRQNFSSVYLNLYSLCILDIWQHSKRPLGSRIQHVGQPQPQPFKYFILNAMGYSGKLHSFLAPH